MSDAELLNADADDFDDEIEQENREQEGAEPEVNGTDTSAQPAASEASASQTARREPADPEPADSESVDPEPVEPEPSADSASDLELFEKYIEEDLDFDLPSRGDLREGTIVEIRPSELLVNVGSKRDGVVPSSDLQRLDQDYVKNLEIGQSVDVVISRQPDDDGIFLLSMSEALQRRDWQLAEELLESGEVSEHEVEGFNKGGLTVHFHHLRGFVPASHVVDMPRNLSEEQRREELESRIGRTLRLKVIEVERRRRRLVMSQSLAEREFQAQRRKELFETIHVGDVIQGEVRSMRPFGAFVDVGGADGLLHVSEIDWRPVNHPRDVLEVGEVVEVQVIRVDPENYRIALSRKRRLPNPWDTVEERYHPGALVPVKITRVVDFGAFAQLEPGVEGLIHISELADIAVAEPLKTVQVGDQVYAKILRVDGNRQRIGLSLRQVLDSERAEIEATEAEAAEVEAGEEEVEEAAAEEADVEEAAEEETATRTRAIPAGASLHACPQDLESIEGVGETYEQRLYAAGIGTFWEVGTLPQDELAGILDSNSLQDADLEAIQASALRLADETESMGRVWDGSEPDDFEQLPGIGEVFERRLYEAGVCTFAALAQLSEERLEEICQVQESDRVNFTQWIEYAREMAG